MLPRESVWAGGKHFTAARRTVGHPQRASSAVGTCHTVGTGRKSGHYHRRPGMGPKQGQHGNDPRRNRKAGELETTPMCWILSSWEKTRRVEGPTALAKESRPPVYSPWACLLLGKQARAAGGRWPNAPKERLKSSRRKMYFHDVQSKPSHKRHQWLCDVAHC